MSFSDDLAVLSSDLVDDLEIGLEEGQEYQDAIGFSPLKAGTYNLKITTLGASKNKAGEPVMTNKDGKKFPVLNYTATVVEPVELEGRRAVSFQSVFTMPFSRNGGTVSGLLDIVRAYDATRLPRTVGAQIDALKELAETSTFRAVVDWEAQDLDWFNAQVEAQGLDTKNPAHKQQVNAIRKQATVKGMRKFKQAPDGTYLPVAVHPISGNTVDAKAVVVRYIPSTQDGVRIG